MICFPNAKINIGLSVVNKRPDGYHNLESIFYPVNWCDVLEIVPASNFEFQQTGINVNCEIESNIVYKAYKLLKDKFNLPPVKIALHKVIPSGAGLGGGSSDGAHCLVMLNQLFDLNLSSQELLKLADGLGSDCSFFIINEPCHVSGKGETLNKSKLNLTNTWIKIIFPDIHISTQQAFNKILPKKALIDYKSVDNEYFFNNINRFLNDFEDSLKHEFTFIETYKQQLSDEGAFYVSMSGSGSSIYGLFKNMPSINISNKLEFICQL